MRQLIFRNKIHIFIKIFQKIFVFSFTTRVYNQLIGNLVMIFFFCIKIKINRNYIYM
jgi:hypothetical protein